MMKKLLGVLMAVCMFIACEDKDNGDPKDTIEVTSGSTTQTIYADQTTAGEGQGVTFTTSGPWTSEVRDITDSRAGTQLDWVILSQTSGDAAGEYTLEITFGVNHTGKDRKAEIRIICGETVITIIVEQKGTTEEGKRLKLLQGVNFVPTYCDVEDFHDLSAEEFRFKYDEMGRIIEMSEYITGSYNDLDLVTTLDYSVNGEIHVTETEREAGHSPETLKYTLLLDEAGRVKKISSFKGEYIDFNETDFNYTNGRLTRVSWDDKNVGHVDYTYKDGLLATIKEYDQYILVDSVACIEEGFSEYPNALLNLDPNAFFIVLGYIDRLNDTYGAEFGRVDRLALFGLLGKRSDHLVGKLDLGTPDYSWPSIAYPTPGEIHQESFEYNDYETDDKLNYIFDEDGYIQTITRTVTVTRFLKTYNVKVTDQLIEDGNLKKGYRAEIMEETIKNTKLGTGVNTYVHTFIYQ